MSLIKKMELVKIPYSRLLKLENPQFANRVIDIIEKHDPEVLKIDVTYGLLVAEKPQIDKLVVWYKPHPSTNELKELRKMRGVYVNAISNRVNVVVKEDVTGVNKTVHLVKNEVDRFLYNLSSSRNEEVRCQRITQYFNLIDQSEDLEEAFATLKFGESLDNLRSVHAHILELTNVIASSVAQRPTEKTTALVASVIGAIKNLFYDLELAPLKFPEVDYEPVFNELNVVLTQYKNIVNVRKLSNKRKAEMANGGDVGELGDITTMTTTSTQISEAQATMLPTNLEAMNENGLEAQTKSESEKAAALSSKNKQLPPANKNEE